MLHVECSGDRSGPAVVFLHGVGTSGWMWRRVVERLPDHFCVVPDLPGHGRSSQVAWHSIGDTAGMISDVITSLASCGAAHRKVHLVGLSLGANVALALLARGTPAVQRAVLSGLHLPPMPRKLLLLAAVHVLAPFMRLPAVARANARPLGINDHEMERYVQTTRHMSAATFRTAMLQVINFAPPDLAAITTPVLAVAGAREQAVVLKSLAKLANGLADCTLRIAPDVGHGWSGEAPGLFADMVRAWCGEDQLPARLKLADTCASAPAVV